MLGGPGRALQSLQPSPSRGGQPGSAQGPSALRPLGPESFSGAWLVGEGGPGVGPPGLPVDGADAVGGPRAGGPARGEAPGGARVWRATARLPGWKTEPPCPRCHQAARGNSKRPGSRAREPRPARPPGVPLLDPSSAPDVGAGQARSPHAQSWVRGAGGPWPASEAPRSAPARKPRSVGSGGEPRAGALLRAGPLCQCALPWSWGPILKTG